MRMELNPVPSNQDIMSVEYTELDSGWPALCFCSDLIIPLTNKTMVNSFNNYMSSDLRFKIVNFKINNLMLTYVNEELTIVRAKVNGVFVPMGYVSSTDIHNVLIRVANKLKEEQNNVFGG